jgi:hypothetical protein
VGVPYGSRARLILLYLQTEAVRMNCREVELGRSLHAWLCRLEIPIGGKQMASVRDQAGRISRCRPDARCENRPSARGISLGLSLMTHRER